MQLKPLAGVLALAASPCFAQPAAAVAPTSASATAPAGATAPAATPVPAAAAPADAAGRSGEPLVRRTVVEDDAARIEELRVRGQLQRVVVTPKGLKSYEIVVGDGSRDLSDGVSPARGAAGQRVWNVLRF